MDWKTLAPDALPMKGKFQWPGRDRLSPRERLLLEARSMQELAIDGLENIDGDIDSVLGFLEYLIEDWQWLRYPEQRKKRWNSSRHKYFLRKCPDYASKIGWSGEIPASDSILDCWRSWCN